MRSSIDVGDLTFILDCPHLKQHLYEGAQAIGLTTEERHKWVSGKLRLIDFGKVRQVIRILKRRGQGQERINNLSKYLKRFYDAVDYDYFRAVDLPIGSGEVESAHRYIPQKRLKITGVNGIQIPSTPCWLYELFGLMDGGMIFSCNNQSLLRWHSSVTNYL
jgi:hypothetical protein